MRVGICGETAEIRDYLWTVIKLGGLDSVWLDSRSEDRIRRTREDISCVVIGGHTRAFLEQMTRNLVQKAGGLIPIFLMTDADFKWEDVRSPEWELIHLDSFRMENDRAGAAKKLMVKIKAGKNRLKIPAVQTASRCLVGIGSSAGGPKALASILSRVAGNCCGILIVQHMAEGFTASFAEYLDSVAGVRVKEAEDGETVLDGTAYLAVNGRQLTVKKNGEGFKICSTVERNPSGFCPSVDVLFHSMAAAGERAAGVILTGMGEDGAEGLWEMRRAGGCTIAQDQETSEIYGMPRAAVARGGVCRQLRLGQIPGEIMSFAGRWMKS